MRIGIDARFYQQSGIGRYLKNLIANLYTLDKKNTYFLFLRKEDFDTVTFGNRFEKVLADFPWYQTAEQREFPFLLQKYKLDLVHFPHFNIPLLYRGKFVVTIHDLIHLDFKMKRATTQNSLFYELKHQLFKMVLSHAVKRSQRIITPSEFVKEEISSRWNVLPKKLTVTYEGVDDEFVQLGKRADKEKVSKTLSRFGIRDFYLFYVGNAHPHKNIEGLIAAFKMLKKKYPSLQLVLSGKDHYFWQRIMSEYAQEGIIFTGFVTDSELVCLYKGARAYVFPSFSEGFGIPLLEAMACGVPVVSSNRSCLPEIGGEAALYFDPENYDDMAAKIELVLNDSTFRQKLILRGDERWRQFSWSDMAAKTLEVYEKCVLP